PLPVPGGFVERARTRRGEDPLAQKTDPVLFLAPEAQLRPEVFEELAEPDPVTLTQNGVEAGGIDLQPSPGGAAVGAEEAVEPAVFLGCSRHAEGSRQGAIVFFQVCAGPVQKRGEAGFLEPLQAHSSSSVSAKRVPAVDWGT